MIKNHADNDSITPVREECKRWLKVFPSNYSATYFMPWHVRGKDGTYWKLANQIWIYDLSQLPFEKQQNLIDKVKDGRFTEVSLEGCRRSIEPLCLWSRSKDFVQPGHEESLEARVPFAPSFSERTWNLGCKPTGESYTSDVGEPFLVVGEASAYGLEDQNTSFGYQYPYDLYDGDNLVYAIVYVKPTEGELCANVREGWSQRNRNTRYLLRTDKPVQQQVFETETNDSGEWQLDFTAAGSIATNGVKEYYWETKDFAPESFHTTNPDVRASGVLSESSIYKSYKLGLTVIDSLGQTDKVEVTIKVRRPKRKCQCGGQGNGECICTEADECGCGTMKSGPQIAQSCDPNEMAGMSGFGDSATQRFVKPGEEMTYTIYFENKAEATAAAQEVRVTAELSKWLDWSSFQIVEIGFNNQIDTGLAGKADGMCEIELDGTSWKVRSEVELNQKKGLLSCYLRIVDETTVDGWPEDPYAGFLPPNDDNHVGEGYIRYKVKVREDAPIGVRIDAEATIVFDYNEPLTTTPAWFNWIGTENGVQPETGCLAWDAVEGATYQVAIWTGEADVAERNVVATSGVLLENRWRLPTSLQNDKVYFWQVTTTTADGTVTESPVWGFDLGGRCTLELLPGWNLFSLPFKPESYTERILLGQNLFGINNNSYVRTSSLEAGKAYWLFQRENGKRYLDLFPSQTRVEADIPLKAGWSMVGPTDTDRHLDSGYTIWYWQNGRFCHLEEDAEGGYTLKAGVGYWVYMP